MINMGIQRVLLGYMIKICAFYYIGIAFDYNINMGIQGFLKNMKISN